MMSGKNKKIERPPKLPSHLFGPKSAKLLSAMPFGHVSLPDFEQWIEAVEREPNNTVRIIATQAYVVSHEEYDPVSSRFYRIVGGTPPPGVHYYIGEVFIFIALAAASGVIGNLAYGAFKKIIQPFLASKSEVLFEEKISFEEYEEVRKEFHKRVPRTDAPTIDRVGKEVALKYRLLIERKLTKK
jgi:hypothetical protein